MWAWGHGMTWWARTTQKSGSRLLLEAAVPVRLSSAFKEQMVRTKLGDLEHRGMGSKELEDVVAAPA